MVISSESHADEARPRIGISTCLLGECVRFDGGHQRDPFVTELLGRFFEWVPVCPEVEVGMSIPRPSVRLVGDVDNPRMMADRTGEDWTRRMQTYARRRVRELGPLDLSGYILKKNSPSCGMERVRVYPERGGPALRKGRGMFAAALMEAMPLLPVEEDGRLNDMHLRDNFVERVFAFWRWQNLNRHPKSRGALVDFHTRHKLLVMAHSEKHMRELGRLVARASDLSPTGLYEQYGPLFMDALCQMATVRKHVNVMQHIMGHFKSQLGSDERSAMQAEIEDYRRRLVPLVVPLTLIRHYVKKLDLPYIKDQLYLSPNPKELLLRNHV